MIWRFFRSNPGLVHLLSFLALCAIGSGWLREHDLRQQKAALFKQELAKANKDAWSWEALWRQESERVAKDGTTVTRTVTRYRTLRDTIVAQLSDTTKLPTFVLVADSAIKACSEYQASCTEYRRVSDSLVASLRRVIALHESHVPKPPRFALSAGAHYDPVGKVVGMDVETGIRLAGGTSFIVRGEEWVGEGPRVSLGLRHAF